MQDSTRVKEYRVKQWRTFTKKELMQNLEKNLLVMLSVAATGKFRHVNSGELAEGLGKLSGTNATFTGTGLTKAIDAAGKLTDDYRKMMTMGITTSAMDAIEERRLIESSGFSSVVRNSLPPTIQRRREIGVQLDALEAAHLWHACGRTRTASGCGAPEHGPCIAGYDNRLHHKRGRPAYEGSAGGLE